MGIDPNGGRTEPLMSDPFEDAVYIESGQVPPPPPPPSDSPNSSLPPGWAAAVSPHDGRMYYWEKATGKTSWTHPSAAATHQPYLAMAPGAKHTPSASITKENQLVATNLSMDSGASGIIASRSMRSVDPLKNNGFPVTHQCYAIVATLLFFPLGLFALIYSFKVESAWDAGRTIDSLRYSRRALLFSRVSITLGVVFWMWFIFCRGPGGIIFDFRPLFEW